MSVYCCVKLDLFINIEPEQRVTDQIILCVCGRIPGAQIIIITTRVANCVQWKGDVRDI